MTYYKLSKDEFKNFFRMKDYAGSRSLRKKHSKTYVDGISSSDDEEEMKTFDPEEKVRTKNYPPYFITEMKGDDVTYELFQRTGFNNPIFIPEKTGLQIRVPDPSFSVSDVRTLVGGKRILEVMNCATQHNAEMTLKDFEEFFTDPDRDDTKLNVISLEFSHTKLDAHVTAPKVVRQLDFTDNVWPRHLKDQQDDSTNDMSKMFYPKVQKYCLMSIAGCYTDFHVDLGGTSVWYHLLRGQKMFWLIPPTQTNLKAFENWTLSGKQGEVFFGDMVEKCGRCILNPGNTFLIPSGWIHAVYTPVDSLVFGGNFLHPFALERQIKIAQIEETLKVPQKFRFPFFTEMLWYLLDKYCYALLGRHHLDLEDHVLNRLLGSEEERKAFQDNIGHPHITQQELRGLKSTVLYLHSLPVNKKNVPSFIKDPVSLIRDIRIIVEVHKNDKSERAINGRPLLYWPGIRKEPNWFAKGKRKLKENKTKAKRMEADGKMYLDPLLVCSYCRLDGWFVDPTRGDITRNNSTSSLWECAECFELIHPLCLPDFGLNSSPIPEMPNLWKCLTCQRNPPALKSESASEPVKEEAVNNDNYDLSKVKDEPEAYETNNVEMQVEGSNLSQVDIVKDEPMSVDDVDMEKTSISELAENVKREVLDMEEKELKMSIRVKDFLNRQGDKYNKIRFLYSQSEESRQSAILEDPTVILKIFWFLGTPDIFRLRTVCKTWNKISRDKLISGFVDLSGQKVTANMIHATANLKPTFILFDWTNIAKQQLTWLLPKIQATRRLSLVGLEFGSQVSALISSVCPNLVDLDLSFVSNLNDSALNKLLRFGEKKSNLASLRKLSLCKTEITDISLRYISQQLQFLTTLSVAYCVKLTDAGLAQIGDPDLYASQTLVHFNISGCPGFTDSGLVHLSRCTVLSFINCQDTGISATAVDSFVQIRPEHRVHNFIIYKK